MTIRLCSFKLLVLAGLGLLVQVQPAQAAAVAVRFEVTVKRLPGSGVCTSQSQSNQSNAVVQVMCATGEFVSIEPDPSKPFTGTNGAAFRYQVAAGSRQSDQNTDSGGRGTGFTAGNGSTVTGWRTFQSTDLTDPLALVITF